MAFYSTDHAPYGFERSATGYGSSAPTVSPRPYPFSGRWNPGAPFAANYVASTLRASNNRRGGQGSFESQRRGGQGQVVPPYVEGLGDYSPHPSVSRSNPYAVPWDQMAKMNQGTMAAEYEGRRYLGGFPDDYASGTRVTVPYASDSLSMRYHAYKDRPQQKVVYGRPVYREGDQARFAHNLNPDQIREWQAFFQINGWKTGLAGVWGEHEMTAMKAFMTAANGVPGGGMRVDVLRARVMADLQSGRITEGTLADMMGSAAGAQTSPGGAEAGAPMEPYTETTVDKTVKEYSLDQGLALLRSDLARQVGRAPTQQELGAFIKALNAASRADPTVLTTVVTTDPMTGNVDTQRTLDETTVDPNARAATFATTGVPKAEREGYQGQRFLEALLSELGM